MVKSNTIFHAEGLWSCSPTWHFDRLLFSEGLAGEKNFYSKDAARSWSVKGNYQGHRGQGQVHFAILLARKVQLLQFITYLS